MLSGLRRDCRGQRRRHLIGTGDPVLNRIMFDREFAPGASFLGLAIFVTTPPARNVGFYALNALDRIVRPCFKIRPLLVFWNQPDRRTALTMLAEFRSE